MSRSSWCCCSWLSPSVTRSATAGSSSPFSSSSHGLVDELAVAGDLGDARAGDMPAFGAGMSIAERLVVGVEDVGEGIVVGAIALGVRSEDKGLEEPGRRGRDAISWG